jgi:hypothetical protein
LDVIVIFYIVLHIGIKIKTHKQTVQHHPVIVSEQETTCRDDGIPFLMPFMRMMALKQLCFKMWLLLL